MVKRYNEIMSEVVENMRKLDSCSKHNFTIDLHPDRKIGKRWSCENCGGEVDHSAVIWYEKGLEHGSNSFTDEQLQIIKTLYEYFILSRKLQPDDYSFGDVQAMKEAVQKHFPKEVFNYLEDEDTATE